MSTTRLPRQVVGDAARLRQVLLNLAGNAVKFTDRGGVAIIVEPGVWPGEIDILVRDTGIGIAPDEHDRIFLEFEQADGGIARKFGGTGLGPGDLPAHRRAHGRPHRGRERRPAPARPSASRCRWRRRRQQRKTRRSSRPISPAWTCMIVAASTVESSLMARRLTRWGARVCVAPDETVAAALLPERAWGAILVDHAHRPRRLRRAGAGDRGACRSRFVLVTPAARAELPALKDAGFTGYLVKPVRAASLAARLASGDGEFERAGDSIDDGRRRPRRRLARRASRSWSPRTTRSTRCWRARC